jgi:phosphotriesterase-related protein
MRKMYANTEILALGVVLGLLAGCSSPGVSTSAAPAVGVIQTTVGAISSSEAGLMLPHEHIFTDLRGPDQPGYGQENADEVSRVMKPLLVEAKAAGVDTIVECTTIGVGRNVQVVARLARESGVHVVVPTGVYGRANFAPAAYRGMSEAELVKWMVGEIRDGIEGSGIKAGFIKLASSQEELKPLEERYLRAAARAAKQTGVAIASHTTSGAVAVRQADILEQEGLDLDRFIWVHAQSETDSSFRERLAARGVYIELDSIGSNPADDAKLIDAIKELILAGHSNRILLSHDAGWYNPGQPNGGTQRGYTYLTKTFVPKLRINGLDEKTIQLLIRANPQRAFGLARKSGN